MANDLAISDTLKEITDKIEYFLNLKDTIVESEYFELAGDSFKLLGLLRNLSTLASKKRFQSFLKTFKDTDVPTELQLKKLLNYIDDEHKAEFISDTFEKILASNSSKSCLIMGTILQKIIDKKENLSHNVLVCIDALTKFFDVDIINFKFLCDYILHNKKHYLIIDRRFKEFCHENKINLSSLCLTIEKSATYQLLFKETTSDLDIDEDNIGIAEVDTYEYYELNSPGALLNDFINTLHL